MVLSLHEFFILELTRDFGKIWIFIYLWKCMPSRTTCEYQKKLLFIEKVLPFFQTLNFEKCFYKIELEKCPFAVTHYSRVQFMSNITCFFPVHHKTDHKVNMIVETQSTLLQRGAGKISLRKCCRIFFCMMWANFGWPEKKKPKH